MFDIHFGNIEITSAVLLFSLFLLLPLQIFLCFKVKSKILRLLPTIILALVAIVLFGASFLAKGWDGLIYLILSYSAGGMFIVCLIGFAISAIIKRHKKN